MFNVIIFYLSFLFSIIKIGLLGFITQALMSYILIISKYPVKPIWLYYIYDLKYFFISIIIYILALIIAVAFFNMLWIFSIIKIGLLVFITQALMSCILIISKYTVKPIWRYFIYDLKSFFISIIICILALIIAAAFSNMLLKFIFFLEFMWD